jgi:aerobic-type carbon monoxide dehydrogenase small subunit (CoxS/CutS family)
LRLEIELNGEPRSAEIGPGSVLVDVLRNELGATGTKVGCMTGDCGACTVRIDGTIAKSCLRLAAACEGTSIQTIECLAPDGKLSALQQAFWDRFAFQCGFCLAGMLFAADDLLGRNPRPSEREIREAISGNLCRCTGYDAIVAAVSDAAHGLPAP